MNPIYTRRRRTDIIVRGLCVAAALFGVTWLALILFTLFYNGLAGMSVQLFTANTPPPGSTEGGLLNAIVGSVIMTVIGVGIGAPLGLFAGTYLAEYGKHDRLTSVIRFINDILLSAPSIIIGLFVYELLVIRMGHFSAIAGAVALGIIAIPVTVRTTEDMLNLVPQGMKDASTAMGAYPWRTITSVIYPAARSGIVTGLLLAVARISGETAPLLFTALNNQFWSTNLNAPMANLPVVIFQFALSPYPNWQQLAWSGALLITLSILVLSITARVVVSRLGPSGGNR
jgi:phosphate transport system permease protein